MGDPGRRIMHIKYFLYLMIALILIGCECPDPYSRLIRRDDLYGRYVANFGETDTNFIDLYPDSLYVAYYMSDEGHLYVDSGRWDYWPCSGFYRLDLYNFKKRHPGWCIHWGDIEEDSAWSDTIPLSVGLWKGKAIWVEYCYRERKFYRKEIDEENIDSTKR